MAAARGRISADPRFCVGCQRRGHHVQNLLSLSRNGIGDEGAGRLAAVLGQCASLAHLNLCVNGIGAEGAERLAAVAKRCPSLTIYFERS